MTVIAWDGKMLAADKLACNGSLSICVTKIRRCQNMLVGVSGDFSLGVELFEWVEAGRVPAQWPLTQRATDDGCGLLVIEEGRILKYERSPFPIICEEPFFAIGSGREMAIACMYLGHSAEKAVQVASALLNDCGKGVDVLRFEYV